MLNPEDIKEIKYKILHVLPDFTPGYLDNYMCPNCKWVGSWLAHPWKARAICSNCYDFILSLKFATNYVE